MIGPRRIRAVAFVFAAMGLAILFPSWDATRAADKEESKLVGKWVLVKANGGTDVIPTSYEFTNKGGVTYTLGRQAYKGKYKLKSNKLTLQFSAAGAKSATRTLAVQKLEGDLLIVKDGPNELEFKKK